MKACHHIRRLLTSMSPAQAMKTLLDVMSKQKTNADLLAAAGQRVEFDVPRPQDWLSEISPEAKTWNLVHSCRYVGDPSLLCIASSSRWANGH